MSLSDASRLTRQELLGYFLAAATSRDNWRVGMELEKMGRVAGTGTPLPYSDSGPSVHKVLELFRERRGGSPVLEAEHLIGIDADWGSITLEPGGQVEWSSRPQCTLDELQSELHTHLAMMREAGSELGIEWLDVAVDPLLPVSAMTWMPKSRYEIMRPYLGSRGKLAHRMMTQTASIQCAFDYADPTDWVKKFRLAALMTPVATALFANSSQVDGHESGHVNYRSVIWGDTDPDRCGLPPVVFEPHFDIEAWLDYVLNVPMIFLRRAHGRVPAGCGDRFSDLMRRTSCDPVRVEDWESHISTIFTEVRSYTYIEVRSADLLPDDLALAVPSFWTGLLYHPESLDAALELVAGLDDAERWQSALAAAAKRGLDADVGPAGLRDLAARALSLAVDGLNRGAACAGNGGAGVAALERLAARHGIDVPV